MKKLSLMIGMMAFSVAIFAQNTAPAAQAPKAKAEKTAAAPSANSEKKSKTKAHPVKHKKEGKKEAESKAK